MALGLSVAVEVEGVRQDADGAFFAELPDGDLGGEQAQGGDGLGALGELRPR